jgi:glycosyltransferase involved in cell wall biosynthesis
LNLVFIWTYKNKNFTTLKKIGFCIIVKNESHVIKRCLDSVKPIIDYVLVVDTGSTDETIQVINNWINENEIPGQVIEEPWQNFAYNRTFALSKLREIEWVDYALMIDADEILHFEEGFDVESFKSSLFLDIYNVKTNMWGNFYDRPQISTNKKVCEYVGVVHEFLSISNFSVGQANGFENRPVQDSNRNQSGNKFLKDIELLEEALLTEPDGNWLKSRYTFYLAQSYRDIGNSQKALENYLKRTELGYWSEEIYVSHYQAANIMRDLNYPREKIIQTYLQAQESNPKRAEALYGLLFYCRLNALHQQGFIIGKHAITLTNPSGVLFSESWIYDYGILDEFSIISFWSGNYKESKEACEILLERPQVPNHIKDRVKQNLQYAIDRLG